MGDLNRFSERLIDIAERFADVVDAAEGRGTRKGIEARWIVLPAAGAAVYALATSSSSLARQTRGLMRRAKDRAVELPDADLFERVKEVSGLADETPSGTSRSTTRGSTSRTRSRSGSSSRTGSRRKTTSSSR
jgi:hypothetical protein